MKIGISYAGFYLNTFESFVDKAVHENFKWLEFIPDQSPNLLSDLSKSRIRTLLRMRERYDLRYSVHNIFYDINLLSVEPQVAAFAFAITEQVLAFSHEIGATSITVHPGYMFPGWRRDVKQQKRFWENAAVAFTRLAELSARFGIDILIENGSYCVTTLKSDYRQPLHLGVTTQEMKHLLKLAPPPIGVTMDVGKAVQSGEPLTDWESCCAGRVRQLQIGADRYVDTDGTWIADMLNSRSGPDVLIEAPLRHALGVRRKLELLRTIA